jgi:hypothetical protein
LVVEDKAGGKCMSLTGEEIAPSKSKELVNKLLGTCRKVRREVGTLLLVKVGIKCLVWRLRMTTKRVPESSLI